MTADGRTKIVMGAAAAAGLCAWLFYFAALSREPLQDWMVYHTAARSFYEGKLALLGDDGAFTAALNARYGAWLAWPLPPHPWVYPPSFLLLLLPFGLPSFAASYALFMGASLAALVAALLGSVERGQRRTHILALLLAPATAITFCLGQNTFLSAALLVGGFGLLSRAPVLGGALLGILTYKPQLFLMVPVALVAARQWRALAGALAAALALVVASACVFGLKSWLAWIGLMTEPSALWRSWIAVGRLHGDSVYASLALLGVPGDAANLAQGVAALGAASAVYWLFRHPAPANLRLAGLLAATFLAAPHVIAYDAVLLAIASAFFLDVGAAKPLHWGEAGIALVAWLVPVFGPPILYRIGCATPLVAALVIAAVILRVRAGASHAGMTAFASLGSAADA